MCLSVGSCLGSCAASAVCSVCSQCGPKNNGSIIPYALFAMTASFVAILLQLVGHRDLGGTQICGWIGDTKNCEHNGAPFRIFTVLSWFFLVHIIMTRIWGSFHKSFWAIKILLYVAVVVSMFFVSNDFFEGYAIFAVVCAAIFIVLQIVLFINMAYDWNEAWVSREWYAQTVAVTVCIYIGAGVVYGVGFYRYGDTGCISNQVNLSMSIVVAFLLSLLSVYAAHGAILPSAGVSLYLSWILFSGLSYGRNKNCNIGPGPDNAYSKVIGMVIVCVAIGYFCLSNSKRETSESQEKQEGEADDDSVINMELAVGDGNENKEQDEDENQEVRDKSVDSDEDVEDEHSAGCTEMDEDQKRNIHFYVLMFLGSLYIQMVFCRWELSATDNPEGTKEDDNIVIANVAAHWAAAALYLITLVAPLICPQRFAGDDEDSSSV